MKKILVKQWLRVLALGVAVTLLAACGRNAVQEGTTTTVNVPTHFDITVSAAKDGQFDLDGATLTLQDLASHLRYLSDIGKPAHSILLQPGEKANIKQQHITALALICRDEHVTGYVKDEDGKLKVIAIVDESKKKDGDKN